MSDAGKRSVATIRDVAREAGVSAMTVSNYLNGRTHLMRDETRQRIADTIRSTGYRPNAQARGFRQGKDFSVGMIVVDPSPDFLVEPFIGHVVAGLSAELASKGYACLLQGLHTYDVDQRTLENFGRSDALCVFPSGPPQKRARFCAKLSSLGVPLVLIEENRPPPEGDLAVVRQDDAQGAALLLDHLSRCAGGEFLYVRPAPVWPANTVREAAFKSILKKARGRPGFATLTCGFGHFDEVCASLHAWLDKGGRCDVILANNDHIGIAVLKALADRGIRVPQDVQVTGFGGFELWNYSSPRLTTVVSPANQLGRQAARTLLDRLAEGRFSQGEWVLPVAIRAGETTAPSVAACAACAAA